jgi:hypothetical protein
MDYASDMTENRVYFERTPIFVMEDEKYLYPRGAEWLGEPNDLIPASVKLAYKDEVLTLIPLVGFARELNTINGLIL